MKKLVTTLIVLFAGPACLLAREPVNDPSLAVVRIKSHGASATIIATTQGRSWILGCAHMFLDARDRPSPAERAKKIYLDGPYQPQALHQKAPAPARLVAWDHDLDLSLMVIDNGPFNCIPVAAAGFRPGPNILSAGYDSMKWPITIHQVRILSTQGDTTYTAEKPWHGRSGGGLIDAGAGVLIGVVQGYEVPPSGNRGVYVSHQAILRFLARAGRTPQPIQYLPPRLFDCPS